MLNKAVFPKRWGEDLAYLFGLLLGDGSLPKTASKRTNGKFQNRYHIYFISNSADFCDKVYIPLFTELFGIKPRKELVKNKLNLLYNCRIESKLIYQFLEEKGYIVGRKAKIAKIPKLPIKYYPHLLAGLLDTDGGKKGNGFGLSTASEHLASFCIETFKKLRIPFTSCPWHYNNHVYHQIYATRKNMQKILKAIPLRNLDKINFINSYSPQ
jgi:hypothetical protein